MDDFGKYIWLILGILYLFFGRGKEKEEKRKPRPTAAPPKKSKPFQEILKELSDEIKEAQEQAGQQVPKPLDTSSPAPIRTGTKIQFEDRSEDYVDLIEHHAETGKKVEEIRQQLESEEYRHMENDHKGLEIDLRQAFIYDAVMNRPYD